MIWDRRVRKGSEPPFIKADRPFWIVDRSSWIGSVVMLDRLSIIVDRIGNHGSVVR